MKLPSANPLARLGLLSTLLLMLAACTVYREDGPDPRGANQKVFVCHKGKEDLQVGEQAIRTHLNHGDYLGRCR